MNRYLYLKNVNTEKVANFLCDMIEKMDTVDNQDNCDCCPASDYCHSGHNGFIDWLKEEYKDDNDGK